MYRIGKLSVLIVACGVGKALAAPLPAQLAPPAPFPPIAGQTLEREFVAPGISRATYRLATAAGPLVVSLVVVDPHEPTVRIGTVLAHDRLVSAGEKVSSMAARSGAVAGINGDYFDIGNTNAPLGIVIQGGALLRTPGPRVALTIARDRNVRFETYRFGGSALDGGERIAITAVNEWPPQGGASLITPAFGVAPAAANVVLAELEPQAQTPGAPPPNGRYRVAALDNGTAPRRPGYALALGPAAQANGTLPQIGDAVDVAVDTDPPLSEVLGAIGGGPALLHDGNAVDDPASPGYAERARRIPVAAAARFADGSFALFVVDGRRPAISIGVNRAELIALMRGLGATDAMQLDSGGSATLVARALGDARASVQNEPSDGVERPVADGLFVYSDAPLGPPARLVVRPAHVEALPGARVPLHAAVVDAAGHPLGEARGPWRVSGRDARIDADDVLHVGDHPLEETLAVERGGVRGDFALAVVPGVAKIAIVPDRPNPEPNGTVALRAEAYDPRGRPVYVGDRVVWSALRGSVDRNGRFTAGTADGFVTAQIGETKSSTVVHVGRHRAPLAAFDERRRPLWHFTTVPANGPGNLTFGGEATLRIAYDFSGNERGAYANAGITVGEAVAMSCAIEGDANGEAVRVAFVDRYGERSALTLAKNVDWTDAQRREVRIPAALAPPLVLQSFYVVGTLGATPNHAAGTVGIRDCELTVPGTAPRAP